MNVPITVGVEGLVFSDKEDEEDGSCETIEAPFEMYEAKVEINRPEPDEDDNESSEPVVEILIGDRHKGLPHIGVYLSESEAREFAAAINHFLNSSSPAEPV